MLQDKTMRGRGMYRDRSWVSRLCSSHLFVLSFKWREHSKLVLFFFLITIFLKSKNQTTTVPTTTTTPKPDVQLKRWHNTACSVFISKLVFVYQSTKVGLCKGSRVLTQRMVEKEKPSRWPFAGASPAQPLQSPALMLYREGSTVGLRGSVCPAHQNPVHSVLSLPRGQWLM